MSEPVRQYVLEAWNTYSQGVEKDRPPEQKEILQMAFFAGASAFFFESMSPDFDEAQMQAMDDELLDEQADANRDPPECICENQPVGLLNPDCHWHGTEGVEIDHECNDCGILIPSWRPICTLCEHWYEERGLPLPSRLEPENDNSTQGKSSVEAKTIK